ncbi:MAG: four helix bundle protein [Deltaproteobacteria bacterium]|nr:four helix bundle protein [Deltaproteobacteria bacterium]
MQTNTNQNMQERINPFEFQNWEVYKRAVELVKTCRELSVDQTSVGIKGFTDQLTRASLSIPLNIAEGYSRYGKKEKLNYFRIAKGSLFECVACIDVLYKLGYLDGTLYKQMGVGMDDIGKMLSGLIRKVDQFENK